MIAAAEVCWQESGGNPILATARIEDTSRSGVCIRLKTPITVGSRLTIKWRWEQFSGITRYCRADGTEFVLGIQRDMNLPPNQPVRLPAAPLPTAELSCEERGKAAGQDSAQVQSWSSSSACLRHSMEVRVGSTVMVRSPGKSLRGIVRYCRRDGRGYLLGIQEQDMRDISQAHSSDPYNASVSRMEVPPPSPPPIHGEAKAAGSEPALVDKPTQSLPAGRAYGEGGPGKSVTSADSRNSQDAGTVSVPEVQAPLAALREESKTMQCKKLLTKFWPHAQANATAVESAKDMEAPMHKSDINSADDPRVPQGEPLSCEDVYHAAGILSSQSDYGIHKVVDMLSSKHIRELSNEVKRASLLMALDAAGTTVDQVLQDATRRQHALDTYEAGRRKQFEEFEAGKARDNSQIQAELDRVTAHYAERIKRNKDLVAHEKESLRTWQSMKEQECQRIAEATGLCKQPAAEIKPEPRPLLSAQSAAAGTS